LKGRVKRLLIMRGNAAIDYSLTKAVFAALTRKFIKGRVVHGRRLTAKRTPNKKRN